MSIEKQNSVFIDPVNCGSSVGYYITTYEFKSSKEDKVKYCLNASVVLTDCSRRIDWCFSGDDEQIKIDRAIAILQEFRKKYAETEKLINKLNSK